VNLPFRSLFSGQMRAIPHGVWVLGIVSMLMDTSSEMILSLLPVYLTSVLGVSALTIGVIEGIAEATASMSKIFSGIVSDVIRKRKILAVIGYGLAAITKPVFPLAQSIEWIVGARFVDRVGKGIRGAPRDALVGDLTPPETRGAAFGLRQALDTMGAFLGPLAAIVLMLVTADNYKLVFWAAVLPAFAALALLIFAVKEPKTGSALDGKAKFSLKLLFSLGPLFWGMVFIAAMGTLARFSEAFLLLRARQAGLDAAYMPMVFVVMNIVYALVVYPVGIISDRIGRRGLLAAGYALLALADVVLALAGGIWAVFLGIVIWGLHMGMTQGLFSALVADTTEPEQRGTAFGIYNFVTGASLLAASVIAGWLWDKGGYAAAFFAGGAFALATIAGIFAINKSKYGKKSAA